MPPLAFMVLCYLGLIEFGKRFFYRAARAPAEAGRKHGRLGQVRRVRRRAARFSTSAKLKTPPKPRPAQEEAPEPGP